MQFSRLIQQLDLCKYSFYIKLESATQEMEQEAELFPHQIQESSSLFLKYCFHADLTAATARQSEWFQKWSF